MTETGQDDAMYAGDSHTIRVTITDDDPDATWTLDDGVGVEWTMKAGDKVVLSKTLASGISVVSAGPASRIIDIFLVPDDTAALEARAYQHGVAISVSTGEYDTVSTGTLTLLKKVRT